MNTEEITSGRHFIVRYRNGARYLVGIETAIKFEARRLSESFLAGSDWMDQDDYDKYHPFAVENVMGLATDNMKYPFSLTAIDCLLELFIDESEFIANSSRLPDEQPDQSYDWRDCAEVEYSGYKTRPAR